MTTRRGRAVWHGICALAIIALSVPLAIGAKSAPILEVGAFSQDSPDRDLPTDWKPLTFEKIKRHTSYQLVKDGDTTVVRAMSEAASSGLTREMRIDPAEYPIVEWRWKVGNVLEKGDVSRKAGDDYPARIYITFEYDSERVGFLDRVKYEAVRLLYGQYPPLGAINYIWESKAPVGTVVPNTYTEQVVMFVLQSGPSKLNTWVTERRNVYEDYKAAFGEEPPMISGVAIMTDTDNTGESATAYFGDIVFKKASP